MGMHRHKSLAGIVLALAAGVAGANTVTFDSLPRHHAADDLGLVVDLEGFTFQSDADLYASGRDQRADPHGQTLSMPVADQGLLVFPDDGLAFTLVSIDLGSIPAHGGETGDDQGEHGDHGEDYAGSHGAIELLYLLGDGSGVMSRLLTLDEAPGLKTFELGLHDVVGFGLIGVPFQLDNVVTTRDDPTSPVPEPSVLLTLVAGLATLASMAWWTRRRDARTVARS